MIPLASAAQGNCLCQVIALRTTITKIATSNFIAGRPKAALLVWFFGGFRCEI